jgi:hypothetical protein
MRSPGLSSYVSSDGYSLDPGTKICRLLEDIDDPQQEVALCYAPAGTDQ